MSLRVFTLTSTLGSMGSLSVPWKLTVFLTHLDKEERN